MSAVKGKLALLAGEGELPVAVLKGLKKKGEEPLVYSLGRKNRKRLRALCAAVTDLDEFNLAEIFASLAFCRVKRMLLAGYVPKTIIYGDSLDREASAILDALNDRNDHALIGSIISRTENLGIKVVDYESVVPEMMAHTGHIAGPPPSDSDLKDVEYGRSVLGRILPLSFGQSLVVCGRSVVAVEAMEGTDKMILRAGSISGAGVLVKGMRADQDRRYDIPVVGIGTLESMNKSGLSCLALEAGNCIILNGDSFVSMAENFGISVLGVAPCPSF